MVTGHLDMWVVSVEEGQCEGRYWGKRTMSSEKQVENLIPGTISIFKSRQKEALKEAEKEWL